MLQSKYVWQPPAIDALCSEHLTEALSVSPMLASLLVSRGVTTPAEGKAFLHGSLEDIHDPFLLLGMKEATLRIQQAVESGEHILIYGDYDADGVSSTSLMIQFMRHLGASYDIYIPHRSNEGYGLHNHALDWAHQQGVSLIITVDTGISAVEQIAHANSLGMEVIVTDHHEPPAILPDAYAIINPKQPGCPYPFKGLAGVGVAYKLTQAMLGEPPIEWTEIVAIGTIADLMPLTGENRVLVRKGLECMQNSSFVGIQALMEVSGITMSKVTSTNVAFGMAPRINASGRLDHAGSAVALLTTDDPGEAQRLSHALDDLNKQRQQVVEHIVEDALTQLQDKMKGSDVPHVIVLAGIGWNVGVVGIVASKILERYYRPVIILGIDEATGMCKGSARSIPSLDIYEALSSCSHVMDHFGGHPAAAGMSLHQDNLLAFENGLNEYAAQVLNSRDFVPETPSDGEWSFEDIPLSTIDEMSMLAPFGMSNPVPKFIFRNVKLVETRKMGREGNHLKLVLQQGNYKLEAVAFGRGDVADMLTDGAMLDVLGELSVNEWNGSRKPQLMLQDLKVPEPQVLDLRGARDPWQEADRLYRMLVPHMGFTASEMAVVFHPDSAPELPLTHLNDSSLWVYDNNMSIQAWNESAKRYGKDRVNTLFMLNVPQSTIQLEDLLGSFNQLANLVLIHSGRQTNERLTIPTRDLFKKLYVLLARIAAEPVQEKDALLRLSQQSSSTVRMLSLMMDVFEELCFIERGNGQIRFIPQPAKRDLDTSRHFRNLGQLAELEQLMLHTDTNQLTEWIISRLQRVPIA